MQFTPPLARPDRLLTVTSLAIGIAVVAALAAQLLTRLIGAITNLAFYGRWSTTFVSPAGNHLGPAVIAVPVVGALIVGVMARYGSPAIRGHGIPEAMEVVLTNGSRVAPRLTFLKPLSAAIAIGTGGPFGAEGPIIATGGAIGSVVGQLRHSSADERKILLAAGAAAGMAATFGSPVSAVLLAVELLLFEYSPRSLIPVAFAATTAAAVRAALVGSQPVFPMPALPAPTTVALATYAVLGAIIGFAAVAITRALYAVEDAFDHLPIHWMWWPAIGAVVVGVVGWIAPDTLGVGYVNIEHILSGSLLTPALTALVCFKLLSWEIALGSGTSGGTLAPLFTIGGGLGALAGVALATHAPALGVDPRIAALVGMAALFAGASHALLTSVVFAFETTHQSGGVLPLLAGCSAAYLVSLRLMPHSIMTEKLVRRGTRVRADYHVDDLETVDARDIATPDPVVLRADAPITTVRQWLASRQPGSTHQGYPVLDPAGTLVGVVTRRDLLDGDSTSAVGTGAVGTNVVGQLIRRPPIIVYDDSSAREAADQMVRAAVGRLPVVTRDAPHRLVGIITRSDLLGAHHPRIRAREELARTLW
jgi:chloride channel protein, CIC family